MDKSFSKYIFKYLNNDMSVEEREELEKDDDFMKKVITLTRDKKYYLKLSDKVKKDGEFVLKLIDMFKEDHGFLAMVGETFFELNGYDSKSIIAVSVALTNIYEETKDDLLHDFYERSECYYKSTLDQISKKLMEMEDPDEREQLGEGFGFVNASFCDSEIVVEYIAKRMTEDLLENSFLSFEEIVHYYVPDTKQISDGKERRFIFDYIKDADRYLADYLALHPRLTDKYIPMVVEARENWDQYLSELNTYKLEQVQNEMERYIVENKLSYDMMFLYRGMIDLSKQRDKIYRYLPAEELNDTDYKKVNKSKLSMPEYGFVKHMVQFMDEAFDMDVEYNDLEPVDNYYEQPRDNVSSIKPYLKKRD